MLVAVEEEGEDVVVAGVDAVVEAVVVTGAAVAVGVVTVDSAEVEEGVAGTGISQFLRSLTSRITTLSTQSVNSCA